MLGKHYLVFMRRYPKIKRNYTISNCMKKEVYEYYLEVIKKELDGKSSDKLDYDLFHKSEGMELVITIKNYNHKGGLSKFIHES